MNSSFGLGLVNAPSQEQEVDQLDSNAADRAAGECLQ
jgi:hypothetical protein